jgi:hypothetical protein
MGSVRLMRSQAASVASLTVEIGERGTRRRPGTADHRDQVRSGSPRQTGERTES